MTNKEANGILAGFRKHGYTIKIGYPCVKDDDITRYSLIKLGSNKGIYGLNWHMDINPSTKKIYMSVYRNLPSEAHN